MKKALKWASYAYFVLMMIFLYLPIFYIIVFSFNDSRSLTKLNGFSLRWYERLFSDSTMLEAVFYTLMLAVLATVIATTVATITSIGLTKSKRYMQLYVENLNNYPIMSPDIVLAIGLLVFFSTLALKKGFLTLLLAHTMFCIPYVMLSIMPKLNAMNPNLIDAALDLGATPMQALRKVIVPEIRPGIISGALISFTMSFDDFVISYFVTGNGVNTIPIMIYSMAKRVNPSVNALSTLIIVIFILALFIMAFYQLRKRKGEATYRTMPASLKIALTGILFAGIAAGLLYMHSLSRSNVPANEDYTSSVLKVYTPGEYIDTDLIKEFEEEFGVEVIIEYFDSNEMMYTKLQAGDQYDILIPSDYMIERLIRNKYLQPLMFDRITDFGNLDPSVIGLDYDPENTYSVPYFWGNVGICFNHEVIDPEVVEEKGWDIFLDEEYAGNVYVYDSERDTFMIALKSLGYSLNTDDEKELQDAFDWLLQLNETMDPVYVTEEATDVMTAGYKDLAVLYSGDAVLVLDENEEMSFITPHQGTNIWCDAMVIPANAENPVLANDFINYMLSYDAAYINSETIGYSSVHQDVLSDMSSEDGIFYENAAYLPEKDGEDNEIYHDNPDLVKQLSQLWIKVKASR